MLVSRILVGTLFLALLASTVPVFAADDCDKALVKDTYNVTTARSLDWRLATKVDEGTYNELRRGGGGSTIIYGAPSSANYSDFSLNLSRYMSMHNESLSDNEFRNIAWTYLDPASSQNYQACLTAGRSLSIAILTATDTDVSIRLAWNQPGATGPLELRWTRPSIGGTQLPTKINPGEKTIVVPRPGQAFQLAANADFQGVSYATRQIILSPLPPPPPPIKVECLIKLDNDLIIAENAPRTLSCDGMFPGIEMQTKFNGDLGVEGGGTWAEALVEAQSGGTNSTYLEWNDSNHGDRPQIRGLVHNEGRGGNLKVDPSGHIDVVFKCTRGEWTRTIDQNHKEEHHTGCVFGKGSQVRVWPKS